MSIGKVLSRIGGLILYKVTPDIIMGFHLFWIAMIIWSTVYLFFDSSMAPNHIVMISAGLIIGLIFGYCPLTAIEEKLRKKRNPDFSLNNSFTTFQINKIFRTNLPADKVHKGILWFYVFSYVSATIIWSAS